MTGMALIVIAVIALLATDNFGLDPILAIVLAFALGHVLVSVGAAIDRAARP